LIVCGVDRDPVQIKALEGMLNEVGWAGALLYNETTGRFIDGHARKKVSKGKKVPVLIGKWTEEQERKILLTAGSDRVAGRIRQAPHQPSGAVMWFWPFKTVCPAKPGGRWLAFWAWGGEWQRPGYRRGRGAFTAGEKSGTGSGSHRCNPAPPPLPARDGLAPDSHGLQ
jgi:hypothetical protein